MKHMVQLGIACSHRPIAAGLYPAVASRKASEFGTGMATAIEESDAAKQSSFYASQKKGSLQQCYSKENAQITQSFLDEHGATHSFKSGTGPLCTPLLGILLTTYDSTLRIS